MHEKPIYRHLPYTDVKSTGAPDFYLAINATFRFIEKHFGMDGLRRYWTDLGTEYFAPVTAAWTQRGSVEVAAYWQEFFAAEPGSEVTVSTEGERVLLDVQNCPAINYLRSQGREIVPCFCQHCFYISEAMAEPAGLTVRIQGGNGRCRQTFVPRHAQMPPQDFSQIEEASC